MFFRADSLSDESIALSELSIPEEVFETVADTISDSPSPIVVGFVSGLLTQFEFRAVMRLISVVVAKDQFPIDGLRFLLTANSFLGVFGLRLGLAALPGRVCAVYSLLKVVDVLPATAPVG